MVHSVVNLLTPYVQRTNLPIRTGSFLPLTSKTGVITDESDALSHHRLDRATRRRTSRKQTGERHFEAAAGERRLNGSREGQHRGRGTNGVPRRGCGGIGPIATLLDEG